MAAWKDEYWWSLDGLRLHYRDYPGRDDRPPIICIPGLTRNARDFEDVAARLAGEWRVICIDLRGRGESAYAKDSMTYVPLVYLQDILRLLDELKIEKYVSIGTSLGGILTMLLSVTAPTRLAGALINDIGPVIENDGLARIKTYVGKLNNCATWLHAARAVEEVNKSAAPDYDIDQWLVLAKRMYRLTQQGRIVQDYDMHIADPFRLPGGEAGVDLWPAFASLANTPLVVVQGALSDILSDETLAEMCKRKPDIDAVVLPRVGHAPTLDEPEVSAAIDRLLAKVDANSKLAT